MGIQKDLEGSIRPLVTSMGYELVEAQFAPMQCGKTLKVVIDCERGVTIGDCAKVSREISALIDTEDLGVDQYRLEVTSPGLNRPLHERKDFIRFSGRKVKIRTKEPLEGRRNYTGYLKGLQGDKISIDVDGTEYSVPLEAVQKAHLIYEGN